MSKQTRQQRRQSARQNAKTTTPPPPQTHIFTPTEFCEAVTDKDGRLDQAKWNEVFDRFADENDELSMKGPDGIFEQIKTSFANGMRYAGETTVPGTTMAMMKFVEDDEQPSSGVELALNYLETQRLQRDMVELKMNDPREQQAYVELMRQFREENGRMTQDYYGVEAHNYGSKKALAALQKKFEPVLKQVPPMEYGYHKATESVIRGDGMLMVAVHSSDKALAEKFYNEMCVLADEVFLTKYCECFQPGSWDHQGLEYYQKKAA
jgi:hypothetical protein